MANKILSRQEIFYLQLEATFGQIPNTAGTATVAAANACRMIQFAMERTTDPIFRKDKTGSRTMTAGTAGRQIGKWTANWSLVTSGVAGTVPDADEIYQSLFGQASAAKAGTATITAATNASPISITATAHGMSDYDCCQISGCTINTAANGFWCVRVIDPNTVTLIGSTGNGVGTNGTITKTAIQYKVTDNALPSFTAWSARKPYATAMQRAIFGCVPTDATFNLGEDIATAQANGPAMWYVDNKNFASATVQEKGGLTTFPDLSAITPVTAGAGIAGFKGIFALNAGAITRVRSGQIKFGTGGDLPRDVFNSGYCDIPEADERNVGLSFNMYEDDGTGLQALEQAAITKAAMDCVMGMGTVPGSVVMLVAKGIQLSNPSRDDGGRSFVCNFGESRAYGSSISALDEISLWML
jgi:hypothetical protein